MTVTEYGGRTFDCVPSPPSRSAEFPMLATLVPRKTTVWGDPYVHTDQGRVGACVAFGWTDEMLAAPVRAKPPGYDKAKNKADFCNKFALARYEDCKRADNTPGEDYEGTTILAGAKVFNKLGYMTGYRWGRSTNDVSGGLCASTAEGGGPIVAATEWYEGMFKPDADGFVSLTGQVVGRHCYVITGYYTTWAGGPETYRFRNSWGQRWGKNGDGYIRVSDFARLLGDGGEACQPIGRRYGGAP